MASELRGLFVSGDLMLGVQVLDAMSTVCTEVTRAMSGRGLLERLVKDKVDVLVVDLEAAALDLNAIGELTHTTGRPLIVAYAPHVAIARLDAARAAGFAAVLSRGQAASQLAAVLSQVISSRPPSRA